MNNAPLLAIDKVSQSYGRGGDDKSKVVLDDVSLTLNEGEIVGLLGRSGCGKSTLLRIVSGLNKSTGGEVQLSRPPVTGPCDGIAMVFQSFALFPWLTVLANVELGLRAKGVPEADARKRALQAIDIIGLDGFENAFPKEISGGMRQRVGFARALVVDPSILLMDEPFSALDVLTAETLRTDLLDLWVEGRMPIKSILMVTHNIEESVLMCDRIVVLSSNPGRIAAEIKVTLQHPRNRLDPEFRQLVDQIYALMTRRADMAKTTPGAFPGLGLGMALPTVSTNTLAGMIEEVAAPLTTARRICRRSPTACSSRSTNSSRSPKRCSFCDSPKWPKATSSSPPRASASPKWTSISAKSCSATICCPTCRSRSASAACSTNAPRITRRPRASARSSKTT